MALNHLSNKQLDDQLKTFRILNDLDSKKEELVGNEERTELETKRAALMPETALANEEIRKVRAAAIGVSQYQYEQMVLDLGQDY